LPGSLSFILPELSNTKTTARSSLSAAFPWLGEIRQNKHANNNTAKPLVI
jgi:hypothetical protein